MPEQQILFSIVIPACNVGKYIARSLESVKLQTMPAFECIVVNETSTDDTTAVIRKTIEGDTRFSLIELPRSGSASVSRNYGVEHARGQYLLFLDGDDWIDTDTLERFLSVIEANQFPDIVTGGFQEHHYRADGTQVDDAIRVAAPDFTGHCGGIAFLEYLSGANRVLQPQTNINVYRTAFLRECAWRQLPGVKNEDGESTPRAFFFAKNIAVSKLVFYHYLRHLGSVTTGAGDRIILDFAVMMNSLLLFWEEHRAAFTPLSEKTWAAYCFNIFFWFFYHPLYHSTFSGKARRDAALAILNPPENRRRIRALAASASRGKRILISLLPLVRIHPLGDSLMRFLVGKLYFPLCDRRNAKR